MLKQLNDTINYIEERKAQNRKQKKIEAREKYLAKKEQKKT